ncbi:CoA transferase [Streptomyces sp. SID8361]|uniref:CaiB/BaiF CoA transferase family protein n=1 Tax=Streptomyces sp. MnatMP-M27 TaxID=1839768 RepID=UPI00081DBA3F|nr:CaiB/BaiF CoA-transferase family protein [Streptomyces sp. MnatMP-M27]MYU11167.1 CoA transferase [Streptomyces sp. SID8361]SCF78868.1 formyl-CoA transferase [Streptomyces sp. MnatMP-M27]
MKPLEGIKVVDLTHAFAGPQCSYQLGLLGADVIKIEPPGAGDQFRHFYPYVDDSKMCAQFMTVNAGKRSMTLNLKHPKGQEILRGMIGSADVLVQNFRVGTAARLGAGEEESLKLNPRLIYCSVSGFGQTGEQSQWPSYDSPIQAMSGLMNMTKGGAPDEPTGLAWVIVDTITGYVAHASVLAALQQRHLTGKGQVIDVSMLEATMSLLMSPACAYLNTGKLPLRESKRGGRDNVSAMLLRAGDGGYLWISASTERQFAALCDGLGAKELLDDPRFATHQARVPNVDELERRLEGFLATASAIEWESRLNKIGAPVGAVRTLPQAVENPLLHERGLFLQTSALGVKEPVNVMGTPYHFVEDTPGLERGAPALGQHTDEVLTELGYSKADIDAFRADGVL